MSKWAIFCKDKDERWNDWQQEDGRIFLGPILIYLGRFFHLIGGNFYLFGGWGVISIYLGANRGTLFNFWVYHFNNLGVKSIFYILAVTLIRTHLFFAFLYLHEVSNRVISKIIFHFLSFSVKWLQCFAYFYPVIMPIAISSRHHTVTSAWLTALKKRTQ